MEWLLWQRLFNCTESPMRFKDGRSHLCDRSLQLRYNQNRRNLHPTRSRSNCFESSPGTRCSIHFRNCLLSCPVVLNYWQSSTSRYVWCLRETRLEATNVWYFGELWWQLLVNLLDRFDWHYASSAVAFWLTSGWELRNLIHTQAISRLRRGRCSLRFFPSTSLFLELNFFFSSISIWLWRHGAHGNCFSHFCLFCVALAIGMGRVSPTLQHVGSWIILLLGLSSLVMISYVFFPLPEPELIFFSMQAHVWAFLNIRTKIKVYMGST